MDECPYCGSDKIEWIPYFPGAPDEPASGPGYHCQECDRWIEPEDEATAKGW